MKALNIIIIGLIVIGLSAFTNAAIHDEEIEGVWEQIGLPDDEMSALNVTAYANINYVDFSNEYIIYTLNTYIEQYLDLRCVEELEEGHSVKYAYSLCTKPAVRFDNVYIDDLNGNRMLDYDLGAEGTAVSISGNYAAAGSGNSIIHSFKLRSEGKWALAWKYTTDTNPRAVHISDDVVYAGDAGNVYSINKERGNLNWKYAVGNQVTHVYGTGNGVVAGTSDAVYFIDGSGNLIKKQDTGAVNSIYVDVGNVAVGTGSNVYLFDTGGNLKFDYKTGSKVSDIKVHSSQGKVVAGAGSSVYVLALDGKLKGKFDVHGTVDTVNLWGNYAGAGVIGNDSYHYLFDDAGVVDIRHGDESEKESEKTKIKVKSVINKGNYAVVTHTIAYTENVTNDKLKFYNLGYARAKDLLENAKDAVLDIEKGIGEEGIEFDITEAEEHLADAEKSFAENNYPETFTHARLSEKAAIDRIEGLIAEAEVLVEKSKGAGAKTSDAEMALTSAKNSIISKEYSNAIIYAGNAKELLSREAKSTYEEALDFFNGVKDVEQLRESLNIPGIQEELDTSDDLINEGKYADAKQHTDRANELINEGLEKYVKSLITDAEEKVGAANAIGSQIIQPEEMSKAQEDIDKAHKAFEEAQGGDHDKLLEVLDYAADAGDAAEQARIRTIAAYLMLIVLLWAVLSALVIMTIKPKWPDAHYPGMEPRGEHKAEEKEEEEKH